MSGPAATTPERILDAAAAEFAERGLHGTRMEHVARRAELNKSLVYRHFRDREQLFDETLRRQIESRAALRDTLPHDLAGMLRAWSRRQRADADFLRLIAQEGLQFSGGEPRLAAERRAWYRSQIAGLERLRREGRLPADMDLDALFFALLLLTVGPVLLPQIATLILGGGSGDGDDGREAESDGGAARWEAFLAQLAAALDPGGGAAGPTAD